MPELWISIFETLLPAFKAVHEASSAITFLLLCGALLVGVIYSAIGSLVLIGGVIEHAVKSVKTGLAAAPNPDLSQYWTIQQKLQALEEHLLIIEETLTKYCSEQKASVQHASTVTVIPPEDGSLQHSLESKPPAESNVKEEVICAGN